MDGCVLVVSIHKTGLMRQEDLVMGDILERLRIVFDGDNVVAKNIALRQAHDEIERLRDALTKIASQSPSTPSKMLIEYAREVFSKSIMRVNNE